MTGQTITHYRILEKLGEGGMGVVYKAEDLKLRRLVALKFLPPHAVENRERFLREARAAASLNHPNICTIHEIDEDHGFIAMEFIEVRSVKDKIEDRPLPLAEALDVAIQTCTALRAAHEKAVVHRDIKPANLMLTPHGQVKIMDFGLAQINDQTRLTKSDTTIGTPACMSPEQTRGDATDTNHPANDSFPSFSRDGKWIYFISNRTAGQRWIWKVASSGGEAVPVTNETGFSPVESPDATWLYYVKAITTPSALYRVPVAGGASVQILDGVVLGNFVVLERGIYYIDRPSGESGAHYFDRPTGETRLQWFDFSSRTTTTVARNLGSVDTPLTASADGRMIFCARVESSVDDLMLVENFH